MPGWWFTIESTTPAHLLAQFESAIREALASPTEVRARMRATSAKQRFPVMVWVKQLEKLQAGAKRYTRAANPNAASVPDLQVPRPAFLADGQQTPPRPPYLNDGARTSSVEDLTVGSYIIEQDGVRTPLEDGERTPDMSTPTLALTPPRVLVAGSVRNSVCSSRLSLASVVGEKTDFCLMKVNANFTDADGNASRAFEQELARIDANSGKVELCIEEYLMKCEKKWFNEERLKKLGMSSANASRITVTTRNESMVNESPPENLLEDKEFDDPPTGLKKFMLLKIGDWPLYSFFLAIVCCPPHPSPRHFSVLNTQGSNHRRKLIPNYPPHRPSLPNRRSPVRNLFNLPRCVNSLVVCFPPSKICLVSLPPFRLIRLCLLPCGAFGSPSTLPPSILARKCRNRPIRRSLRKRLALLLPQLWRRRR